MLAEQPSGIRGKAEKEFVMDTQIRIGRAAEGPGNQPAEEQS